MKIIRIAALAFAAVVSLAAAKANWTATVTVADDGTHVLGNPDAKVKLTEFVSYTCPHCATFQKESEGPLRIAYVMSGNVSVKVSHVLRDPVDTTVAMLTNCGKPDGFFSRHHTFLHAQETWLAKARATSSEQRQRWSYGPIAARLQAIARDLDFYSMMEQRGFTRPAVDRCLGDEAMLKKLAAQTAEAERLGVPGTPSFTLNGVLLDGAHDWASLQPKIRALIN